MSKLVVDGIVKEIEGKRLQALFDINVYLQSPVGVGDHSNLSDAIKDKFNVIDKYDSLLSTIQKYSQNEETEPDNT